MTDTAHFPTHTVAIGLTASDLPSLDALLSRLPVPSGLGFILVTREPRDREAVSSAVAAMSAMRVVTVDRERPVEADVVHLAPAGHDLAIERGVLRATPIGSPDDGRGIDAFFTLLAEDQGDGAIGVLFAGAAGEGFAGVRTLKEVGGMVMREASAEAGASAPTVLAMLADYLLPATAMASELVAYARRSGRKAPGEGRAAESGEELARIIAQVHAQTGVDFSDYKKSTLLRRIDRRMAVNQLPDAKAYVELLANSPHEVIVLYRELLIGVTRFFRDADCFATLSGQIIPKLVDGHSGQEALRIWVAGCSTGEEAYSIAILLREALATRERALEVKIFATDIDREAIEFASAGIYPPSIANDVSVERLARWFVRRGEGWQVSKQVRSMVVFAPHNLLKDPPFYKIDLVSCRNLLIYLQPVLQRRIFTFFHFALVPEGHLLLGQSESLGEMSQFFATVDARCKLYQKKDARRLPVAAPEAFVTERLRATRPPLPGPSSSREPGVAHELQEAINQALVREMFPAFIVVGENFDLIHISGDVGRWLTLPSGRPSLNILKLAPPDLGVALGTGIRRALSDATPVVFEDIQLDEHGARARLVIRPFLQRKDLGNYVVVVFEKASGDGKAPVQPFDILSQSHQRIRDLELEVEQTNESLQAAIEELETSNEELQATNEEVLAANEELQSANEELQSVNEELYTVNAEYQGKISELTELNNDILNFLSSTNIGTLFLDQRMQVRKFTPTVTQQINLIDNDIGRPFSHISNNIKYPDLARDAEEVLKTLVPKQREVSTTDGKWFLMRLLPYRTEDNVIKGVVITFIDISDLKEANVSLRNLATIVEHASSLALITDGAGVIEYVNQRLVEVSGWKPHELIGRNVAVLHPPADQPKPLPWQGGTGEHWHGRLRGRTKDGSIYWEDAQILPMHATDGQVINYLVIGERSEAG